MAAPQMNSRFLNRDGTFSGSLTGRKSSLESDEARASRAARWKVEVEQFTAELLSLRAIDPKTLSAQERETRNKKVYSLCKKIDYRTNVARTDNKLAADRARAAAQRNGASGQLAMKSNTRCGSSSGGVVSVFESLWAS